MVRLVVVGLDIPKSDPFQRLLEQFALSDALCRFSGLPLLSSTAISSTPLRYAVMRPPRTESGIPCPLGSSAG
jgi:hypothetical protein